MEVEILGYDVENVEWVLVLWIALSTALHIGFSKARTSVVAEVVKQMKTATPQAIATAQHKLVSSLWFSEILGIIIAFFIVMWIISWQANKA